MNKKITTAVFPIAGMGTRFLPITKAGPKEMLPIIDKPIIQYAVEEAVAAGIKHLVFVTSGSKRAVEDYFDENFELKTRLQQANKTEALQQLENILPNDVHFSYVRQKAPLGLGHAILSAEAVVGDNPFAVLLPDDIIYCGEQGCLQQMLEVYVKAAASVIAVEQVPGDEVDKYGVISFQQQVAGRWLELTGIVEKPELAHAPSNYAVTGRYILSPSIFSLLKATQFGKGGELQLTDAIAKLINKENVVAYPFIGERFDCGCKQGYVQAFLFYALKHPELRQAALQVMADMNCKAAPLHSKVG